MAPSPLDQLIVTARFLTQLESFPIFCAYILMVLLSSQWRKMSSPLDLRHVLVVYNFTASVLNLYTTYGFARVFIQADSSFLVQPFEGLTFVYKVYWFAKIFELLDTVFMIVRHKQRQISFLHVFHHSSMLLLSDIGYNHYPYIAIVSYLSLNSFVHVWLYLYYALAALGHPPEWKKMLTQFQILQFLIDGVHATIGYLYHGYCVYGIFYTVLMTLMFSNFYYNAYVKKGKLVNKLN